MYRYNNGKATRETVSQTLTMFYLVHKEGRMARMMFASFVSISARALTDQTHFKSRNNEFENGNLMNASLMRDEQSGRHTIEHNTCNNSAPIKHIKTIRRFRFQLCSIPCPTGSRPDRCVHFSSSTPGCNSPRTPPPALCRENGQ